MRRMKQCLAMVLTFALVGGSVIYQYGSSPVEASTSTASRESRQVSSASSARTNAPDSYVAVANTTSGTSSGSATGGTTDSSLTSNEGDSNNASGTSSGAKTSDSTGTDSSASSGASNTTADTSSGSSNSGDKDNETSDSETSSSAKTSTTTPQNTDYNVSVDVGKKLAVTGYGSTSTSVSDHRWYSDNASIATVYYDSTWKPFNAVITGIKAGETKITHTYKYNDGNKTVDGSETYTVHVIGSQAATGITISASKDTVEEYATINMTATVQPYGSTGHVVWSSSDDSIATIDQNGKVTGKSPGEVEITARVYESTQPGASLLATSDPFTITVTRGTKDVPAQFFYLKTPTSDPSSNSKGHWSSSIGNGEINIKNAQWDGVNIWIKNEGNRVVKWPAGFENGVVSKSNSHWMTIFNAFKGTVGTDVKPEDVESITLIPYKISKNYGNDYHVDCTVEIKVKDIFTATYYVWDAGATGYSWAFAENVRDGGTTSPKSAYDATVSANPGTHVTSANLPETKTVNGVKYTLKAWYSNPELNGTPTSFDDGGKEITSNVSFYAKYLGNHMVHYDLNGGTGNFSNAQVEAGDTYVINAGKPAREGYAFDGWKSSYDDKVYDPSSSFAMPDADVTLTAQWTAKDDGSYVVRYVEKGSDPLVNLAAPVTESNLIFGTEVTVKAIDIDGYVLDGDASQTFVVDKYDKEVLFYYTKRADLTYTVNYLEQGTDKVLHEAKRVDGQTFGAEVTEEAIDIPGYTKVDPTTATIKIAVDGNEINFYYEKRNDLSYTVNYLEKGSDEVLATAKVVSGQSYGDEIEESAIDILGYTAVEPVTDKLTISDNDKDNVINFYYEKRTDLKYTVNYLEQGTDEVLHEAKVVDGQTYGAEVTEEAISITGYNLTVPDSMTIIIGADSDDNVINFYYSKKDDLEYTVNYLEKGTNVPLAEAKVVERQSFKSEVTEEAIDIPGYTKVEPTSVTIQIGVDADQNVINFYYEKRADLTYTVKYLEKGTDAPVANSKTVDGQVYGTEVTENAEFVPGYNQIEPISQTLTIGADDSDNVITFYYEKKADLTYTVKYLEEGTDVELADEMTVGNQTYGDRVSAVAKNIPGYMAQAPTVQIFTIDDGENVVVFYYTKRADLSFKVNYLDQETNKALIAQKTVEDQTFGAEVTENAVAIPGYQAIEPTSVNLTIGVDPDANVINFYYAKRTDMHYTVNYLEKGSDTVLAPAKKVNGQTFQEVVSEDAISILGYNPVGPTTQKLTIEADADDNVINFYYEKKTDLTCTVKYLDVDTNEELAPTKEIADLTYNASISEDAISIKGYNVVGDASKSLVIGDSDNLIVFYYAKRGDIAYVVNYYDTDTHEMVAESKTVDDQKFGDTITEKAIDITGYTSLDPTEQSIKLETDGNVINFYYAKRADLEYTVNYLEKGTENKLADSKVADKQVFGSEVSESAIAITGYTAVEPSSENLTIGVNNDENVINFYYEKRTDLTYTVNYLEQYTNQILEPAKVVENQTYNSVVTEDAPDIKGYDAVAPTTETIKLGVEGNVINFYYVKHEYTLKINYVDEEGNEVAESHVEALPLGTTFSVSSPEVDGYTLKDSNQSVIFSDEAGIDSNVTITVVYVKNPESPVTPEEPDSSISGGTTPPGDNGNGDSGDSGDSGTTPPAGDTGSGDNGGNGGNDTPADDNNGGNNTIAGGAGNEADNGGNNTGAVNGGNGGTTGTTGIASDLGTGALGADIGIGAGETILEEIVDNTQPVFGNDDDTPLANNELTHTDCIMHFLIMLVALLVVIIYTFRAKKRQEDIHELKEELIQDLMTLGIPVESEPLLDGLLTEEDLEKLRSGEQDSASAGAAAGATAVGSAAGSGGATGETIDGAGSEAEDANAGDNLGETDAGEDAESESANIGKGEASSSEDNR